MAIEFYKDTLFALGWFDEVNGQPLQHFAKWVGNPSMVDSCAPPARQNIVSYNVGMFENTNSLSALKAFPNPTEKNIFLYLPKDFYFTVFQLKTLDGIILQCNAIAPHITSLEINLEPYSSGIYFLTLKNQSESHTLKIMKQ